MQGKKNEKTMFTMCYLGGGNLVNISNNITFFHYDIRAG